MQFCRVFYGPNILECAAERAINKNMNLAILISMTKRSSGLEWLSVLSNCKSTHLANQQLFERSYILRLSFGAAYTTLSHTSAITRPVHPTYAHDETCLLELPDWCTGVTPKPRQIYAVHRALERTRAHKYQSEIPLFEFLGTEWVSNWFNINQMLPFSLELAWNHAKCWLSSAEVIAMSVCSTPITSRDPMEISRIWKSTLTHPIFFRNTSYGTFGKSILTK